MFWGTNHRPHAECVGRLLVAGSGCGLAHERPHAPRGCGSLQVQRPLATAVIGGLLTSTLLTLLVLPTIYRWVEEGHTRATHGWNAASKAIPSPGTWCPNQRLASGRPTRRRRQSPSCLVSLSRREQIFTLTLKPAAGFKLILDGERDVHQGGFSIIQHTGTSSPISG